MLHGLSDRNTSTLIASSFATVEWNILMFLTFWTAFSELPIVKTLNDMIMLGYGIYGSVIIEFSYTFKENVFHWMVHDEAGR